MNTITDHRIASLEAAHEAERREWQMAVDALKAERDALQSRVRELEWLETLVVSGNPATLVVHLDWFPHTARRVRR